jgi:hypothetical protein
VLPVFTVQAASSDAAQAGWHELLAEAQKAVAGAPAGVVKLTANPDIADRGEWVEADLSQIGIAARGLAFLKGDVGVYVIDLVRGAPAPSRDALSAEAQTVLGRLP